MSEPIHVSGIVTFSIGLTGGYVMNDKYEFSSYTTYTGHRGFEADLRPCDALRIALVHADDLGWIAGPIATLIDDRRVDGVVSSKAVIASLYTTIDVDAHEGTETFDPFWRARTPDGNYESLSFSFEDAVAGILHCISEARRNEIFGPILTIVTRNIPNDSQAKADEKVAAGMKKTFSV